MKSSVKIKNKLATQHYLSLKDQGVFYSYLKSIQDKIDEIVKENELEGKWALSNDSTWLVKASED